MATYSKRLAASFRVWMASGWAALAILVVAPRALSQSVALTFGRSAGAAAHLAAFSPSASLGVQPKMHRSRKNLQVLYAIVALVAVPVVNVLIGSQAPSQIGFHNHPVLQLWRFAYVSVSRARVCVSRRIRLLQRQVVNGVIMLIAINEVDALSWPKRSAKRGGHDVPVVLDRWRDATALPRPGQLRLGHLSLERLSVWVTVPIGFAGRCHFGSLFRRLWPTRKMRGGRFSWDAKLNQGLPHSVSVASKRTGNSFQAAVCILAAQPFGIGQSLVHVTPIISAPEVA